MAKSYQHPFLYTDGRSIIVSAKEYPVIGLNRVKSNRHHLYPKNRDDIPAKHKEPFLLRLWEYKHFQGWNQLFQFSYIENNKKHWSELTIDEIITLMAIHHPFITQKVGTQPWKILFKDKTLDDACDLLCRMLSRKFNYAPQRIFPKKITFVKEYRLAA